MVAHIVIFKARQDLPEGERRAFAASFERAARAIPSVRGIRIGQRVLHGAGYEAVTPDTADYLAIVEFDDVAGLQEYLVHPAHEELASRFRQALSSALIVDFDVGGLAMLETLLEKSGTGGRI